MIPFVSIIGVVVGFVLAAKFVFGPLRSMERRPLLWIVGPAMALLGVILLLVGGLLMSFRSPLCGFAFAGMAFFWTAGGNVVFKQMGFYRRRPLP